MLYFWSHDQAGLGLTLISSAKTNNMLHIPKKQRYR